jgi:type I restriction enzyme, S subunit
MSDYLPEGWALVTLSNVCDINPPKPPVDALPPETLVTFVPMPAVDAELGTIANPLSRHFAKVRTGFTAFRDEDVIIAKITPCMENGKAAIACGLLNGLGFGSTEFHVLRPAGAVLPEYVYYLIRQQSFRREAENEMTGSVGQKRVPAAFLETTEIPLPPLAEQKRIVAKVEALLAGVNDARRRIAKVPAILKRLRRSVLVAACSGRLTADWREEQVDLEPAPILISRILQDRMRRYDKSPIDLPASRRKSSAKSLTLERQPVDTDLTHDLPDSWEWVTWNDLADWITYGFTRPMPHVLEGIAIVTAKNVRDGHLELDDVERTTPQAFAELSEKDKPRRGEILITKDGAIRGRAALVQTDEPFCISQAVAVVRFGGSTAYQPYLLQVIQSRFTQRLIEEESAGTAIPHISITSFGRFPVPLPPMDEQHEIVRRVDALFRLADAIEKRVVAATARAEKLTQAILAKAFRGELVPTEAELARREGRSYEPASALLQRLRRERCQIKQGVRRKPRASTPGKWHK